MALYAVVEDGSKQYRVQEGMTVDLEKKPLKAGARFEFDRVLLTSDGEHVHVGKPLVAGARVVGQVLDQIRGPKLVGFMYKRRKNMRRKFGHRQSYTRVRIQEISPPPSA
jgi:large subunit ribosomal protein L21